MTHNVNTHVGLGELKEIVARLEEDPQDLITCIKTLMDHCELINDEHCKHELHHHIVHAYRHKGKLLGKLMAKPFKTPSNGLADIAVNHFAIQHAREQVSYSSKPVDTICQDKGRQSTQATAAMVTHHLHPPRTVPAAHDSTQPADHTVWHMIPIVPNATNRTLGTKMPQWQATPIKECTSHLGHSRGSPDAHLGTTTTAKGRATRQTPSMSVRTTALKMR